MRNHRIIFVVSWGLLFGLSVYALVRSSDLRLSARNLPSVAKLGKTDGQVQARGEDALGWARIDAGEDLHDGDSIATGESSAARLEFPDGRALDLGAGTLLEIRAKGTGTTKEYLVSLLKGLVVSNSETQNAAPKGSPAPAKVKIVSGTKEFQLSEAKMDLALEAKSRTKDAEVLFASKNISVRDIRDKASVAPVILAPIAKVASIAAIKMQAPVAFAAPLPTLRKDVKLAVVNAVPVASPEPAKDTAPEESAEQEIKEEKLAAIPPPEPTPAPAAVQKSAKVVFPATGTTLWVTSASAKIPVRIEPMKGATVVEVNRASGGRGKKLAFASNRADSTFTAADFLGVNTPSAQLRAGNSAFNLRSFSDLTGAVTVEMDNLAVKKLDANRGFIVERKLQSSPPAHVIRLASAKDLQTLAPLLEGASGFRIATATGLAEKGAFLVRNGAVIAQVAADGDLKTMCQRLSCDLIFKGRRSAVASTAEIEEAIKGKAKAYLVMKDTLVPLNAAFFRQYSEVRSYVKKQSTIIFTEPVELITK